MGNRALHIACAQGNYDWVKYLVHLKIFDQEDKNDDKTALEVTEGHKNDIIELLSNPWFSIFSIKF